MNNKYTFKTEYTALPVIVSDSVHLHYVCPQNFRRYKPSDNRLTPGVVSPEIAYGHAAGAGVRVWLIVGCH